MTYHTCEVFSSIVIRCHACGRKWVEHDLQKMEEAEHRCIWCGVIAPVVRK